MSAFGTYVAAWGPNGRLVVIDPEDREQVERVTAAFANEYGGDLHVDETQAALRSLIAPPRPPEPMGLGAVVEDKDGNRWIRKGKTKHGEDWTHQIGDAFTANPWSRIAAVRVLSEGWSE